MFNIQSIYFAFILLIASSLFWSGNFFTGKIASLYDLSPFKLSFLRWSLAFLLLLPFTYKKIVADFEKYKKNLPYLLITSILGVETRYGKIMGNYRVIDSLTTLGFDYPRRSSFFKDELTKFFLLTRENNLDIFSVKGSYAGAMGYGQFISSSYRAYAIDFDGDNSVDLFNSVDDAIGSIANYLKIHGWQKSGKIVTKSSLNNVREIYKPHDSLSKFIPLSFNEDEKDIFFIGDDNFVAITKYNRSHFYAMAVYYLAEEFKK